MAVFIIYGDPFLVSEDLAELRMRVGPTELLESNSHHFVVDGTEMDEVLSICNTLPFLAQYRLVVLEGFLGSFEHRNRRRGRGNRAGVGRTSKWEALPNYVQDLPDTTLLAFIDGPLAKSNQMLLRLKDKADVKECFIPRGDGLYRWIRARLDMKGVSISVGALRLLRQYVGVNLQVLDMELEKLSLYVSDGVISEKDVRDLVPQVRESNIFIAVDAILEGKSAIAMKLLRRIIVEGASLSYVQAMITRQLRLVTLAKDLSERGVPYEDLGIHLEIRAEFVLKKTLEQAKRFSWERIKLLYKRLMEMDLAVRQGNMEENIALELLVADSIFAR